MATNKSIRIPGQANYASNFEVQKQALLDAREVILTTAADLVKPETWEDEDGNVWLAKGLKVAVMNNGGIPELYILRDPDNYTNPEAWYKIGDIDSIKPLVIKAGVDDETEHDNIPIETTFAEVVQAVVGDNPVPIFVNLYPDSSLLLYVSGIDFTESEIRLNFVDENTRHCLKVTDQDVWSYSSSQLSKADIGLSNVTNDAQVKRSEMGSANGVATLGSDGKVPSAQLPSYVDDVIDLVAIYPAKSNIPTSGLTVGAMYFATSEKKIYTATSTSAVDGGQTPEAGKIYVVTSKPSSATADVNTTWRWSGSAMVQVGSALVLGTVSGTAFDGGKGQALQTWKEGVDDLTVVTGGSVATETGTVNLSLATASMASGSEGSNKLTLPAATTSKAGVMTSADKTKLDAIPEGDEIVTSVVLQVETI